jgi:rfaE bifunctional protein kinase chain/domain
MAMNPDRFQELAGRFPKLRVAVIGDFSLDRYLEIDPALEEISIETGLPVHNVVRVRSQAGAAGTILNNLAALGVGLIHPVGFVGDDGEGFELRRALAALPVVNLSRFLISPHRRTFTYCKPLVLRGNQSPLELNRLDSKNWTPTPPSLQEQLIEAAHRLAESLDAIVLLDQVEIPETGVVTTRLLGAIAVIAESRPELLILADSRRGLKGYPRIGFKMNRTELGRLMGLSDDLPLEKLKAAALTLARKQGRKVFVTLAEQGLIGAAPTGDVLHLPIRPVRGEIDVVGAGDAVNASLVAALAAGGTLAEALELANAAASIVIHQLGTTGTASPAAIRSLLFDQD